MQIKYWFLVFGALVYQICFLSIIKKTIDFISLFFCYKSI